MDDILSCIQTLNGLGEKGSAAVQLINKYTTNILDNPTTDKYRKIRIENAKFNSIIWSLEVARNLMYALGFEQEGSDYLVLPEDVDLSLIRDVFVKPVTVPASIPSTANVPAQKPAAAPSLRLGRTINDQSYFDVAQPDMTLLSYLVEMGYDRKIGQRALVATGNKGVQPAMDWISANPHISLAPTTTEDIVMPTPTVKSNVATNTEDKPKPPVQAPISRYESTAAERHAFQEKKRKEQILAAKIAKKEEIAAKKILLASVEAEKKSRQGESATATVTEQKSKPPQPSSSQSSIALIKMRMPNGEVSTLQLESLDTVETLYQHASEAAKTLSTDVKLLSPTSMEVFSDKSITLEEAGLTPRGLIVVRLISQETDDPR